MSSFSVLLPHLLTLLPLGIHLPFLPYLQKKIPLQPRWPSASSAWFPIFRNCLFLCPQELVLKKWPALMDPRTFKIIFPGVLVLKSQNLKFWGKKKINFFPQNLKFKISKISNWQTKTTTPGDFTYWFPEQPEVALPMSKVEVLLVLFLLSPEILNLMASWLLWPRDSHQSPLKRITRSSLLTSNKSRREGIFPSQPS